ncbi:MAG: MFS transporter [Micromonosporaceae bacterium]|nr:MFS transporter [Micromonosporaceae bacterium]
MVDRRPLAFPAFRRLWTASVVVAVAGSFHVVAVPAQLFALTGSSATVGLAAGVSLATLAASAAYSGALADTLDRRVLLLVGHILLVLAYLGLWGQAVLSLDSVPVVLALLLGQGAGLGATLTTAGAVVPRLVPGEVLVAANGLSSLARYAGAVVGPLLAGALIPLVGIGPLYLLDAIAMTAVLWAVVRLPALPAPARATTRGVADLLAVAVAAGRGIAEGARYLVGQRVLLATLGVDLAAMVFALPSALYPELAALTYGPHALGLLFAAFPAGVLATGLISGTVTRIRRHGAMMAGAAIAWGLCVIALAVASDLWLALVALALGGAANFVLSTFRNAISQAYTDDALRGRIQGILTVVLLGGPQLATVAHGVGGALVGPRWAIGLGGALTATAVVALLRLVPQLWRYVPREQSTAVPAAGSDVDGRASSR